MTNVAERATTTGKPLDVVVTEILSKGDSLYFPRGAYALNNTIRITSSQKVVGDGVGASIIFSLGNPAILIGNQQDPIRCRGAGVENIEIHNQDIRYGRDSIKVVYCALAYIRDVRVAGSADGLYIEQSLVDVHSLDVADHASAAVRIVNCGGDNFLTKVRANTSIPVWNDRGIMKPFGAWLSNAGGAQFTDCDFIGGRCGVMLDLVGSSPGGSNDWYKFTSVSCDTVKLDCWHIVQARGLQLSNCWSGSFPNGSGIWFGPDAIQVSLMNHQFQNGLVAVNNNSTDVRLTGGLISNCRQRVASSVRGQPVMVNVG